MARRRLSNPLALAVLATLCQRPMHPYEMATTMREQHYDTAVKLNYGSLYSVVESLRRIGCVNVDGTERTGNRPERTVYRITPAGRVELAQWLRSILSTPACEFPVFSAGLAFMVVLRPDEVRDQLVLRAERLAEEVAGTEKMLRSVREGSAGTLPVARVFLVEDEYQLAMREAELVWVRSLVKDIEDGSLPGMDDWRRHHEESRPGGESRPGDAAAGP